MTRIIEVDFISEEGECGSIIRPSVNIPSSVILNSKFDGSKYIYEVTDDYKE